MKIKNTTAGFTLIELLVVIAIIGLLSSVILASLGTARGKARDAKRLSDIKQMQTAMELYASDHSGQFPNLSYVICETNVAGYASLSTALSPYMAQLPFDPAPSGDCAGWGRRYVVISSLTDYKIIAHAPEYPTTQSKTIWDPLRDGGSNGAIVDGTAPWAFAVYTTGCAATC